ncbi:MAG: histidinol-phosphate transaminase [Kiritimatiellae bacterium]|nr:histidinol-phosphate transaminase [Kiritimatiellia bacterium]
MKTIAKKWLTKLGRYETGKPIEEAARELGFDNAENIIKLASNENALGPSPRAVRAMKKAAAQMHRYPDSGAFYLRNALAEKLRIQPDQILIANGSNEIIEFIGHVFLDREAEAVISDHAFAIFRLIVEMFEARPVIVPMRDFTHDLRAMRAAVTPRTKVVFVANPNNPTGTMVKPDELHAFMEKAPPHAVVVLDEAYLELLPPAQQPDTLRYVRAGRKVIVLRTFSKTYGLAGLRVGYAIAPAEGIEMMAKIRQPFNVNAMALAAAAAALKDDVFVAKTRQMVGEGLRFFEDEFRRSGIEYIPSAANFMLVKVGNGRKIFNEMQKKQVIVRPMDGYNLPEYIRITVGRPAENKRCLRALQQVLSGAKIRRA